LKGVIRIGGWRVEPHHNALIDGTREVHIEPRAMQLLLYLAEHAGAIVTKEAIIRRVGRRLPRALTYSIFRRARRLRRRPSAPLHTDRASQGYRLIAPVSEDDGTESASPAGPAAVVCRPAHPGSLAAGLARAVVWVVFQVDELPQASTSLARRREREGRSLRDWHSR
jgi:DNA-binding winged helix-turn-helix (wHTH) protein